MKSNFNARKLIRVCGLLCSIAAPALADGPQTIRETYTASNGDVFVATKVVGDGIEGVTYERHGQVFTHEQMLAHVLAHPTPVVDPAILAAARTNPNQFFQTTVLLKERPSYAISKDVWAKYQPVFDDIVRETAEIRRSILPQEPMDMDQERAFLQGDIAARPRLTLAQQARVRELGMLHEQVSSQARAEIRDRLIKASQAGQNHLAQRIAALGGVLEAQILTANGVEAKLPGSAIVALAADPLVGRMYPKPIGQPELNLQKTSLALTTGFWANGIDGGIWDAGIIDTGVQQDHPAFAGKTFQEAPGVGTTDTDGHGTAVCGILVSADATNTGMAFGSTLVDVGSFNDVQADADWMVVSAPSDSDPEFINLSGGFPTSPATDIDYNDLEKFFDGLTQDQFCLLSKSAGNQGNGTTTITHPAGAYNCIAVANMDDRNTTTRTDDVITSSSSRGPTLGGRFKPDLSAPGTNTTTCSNLWASGADFTTTFGGTSSASPHAAGGSLLLTDLRSSDNPYSNKAILINTSDTWTHGSDATSGDTSDDGAASGSQWNKVYGWGYLDLGEAYINGTDVFVSTVDDGVTPAGPDYKFFKGRMFNNEKATLVWQRHVTYNGAAVPTAIETFTDLDLICYRQGTGAIVSSSSSVIQNVEQIAVAATEDVVLKVECFTVNLDPDIGIESFALATEENFVAATGPALTTTLLAPDVSPGQDFTFAVRVNNTGDLPAHGVTVDLGLPAGYSIVSGADPQNIGTIADGGNAVATWRLRAPCNTTAANITWTTSSASYGETFTALAGLTSVTPGVTPLTSNVVVSDTDIEKAFSFTMIPQSSGGDWYVVAMSAPADHDVWADDDQCFGSPYQTSTFGGLTKDFIMSNSHLYAPGGTSVTHYALATFGTDGDYSIEMNAADDMVSGVTGGSRTDTFAAGEIADCTEVLGMAVGRRYFVTVDVTSGTCDPSVWMYVPSRTDGDRGNPTRSRNAGGAGVDETMLIGPLTEAGFYGFAIINENLAAGNYTFSVTPVCTADVDDGSGTGTPDGGVTIDDLLYYLGIFEAGVIEADVDDGSGTGTPDGGVTIDDLLYFLLRFEAGC